VKIDMQISEERKLFTNSEFVKYYVLNIVVIQYMYSLLFIIMNKLKWRGRSNTVVVPPASSVQKLKKSIVGDNYPYVDKFKVILLFIHTISKRTEVFGDNLINQLI